MSGGFFLGLISGIPLAILANLLTRPIESWLDSRIRSRALRRARETRQYIEEAKRYKEHPEDFYAFLLQSLGWITTWTMVLIVATGALLAIVLIDPLRVSEQLRVVGTLVFALITINSVLTIQRYSGRAIDMATIVRSVSEDGSLEKSAPESQSEDIQNSRHDGG